MFYSHINHSIQHHNQNNNINNDNFIGLSIKIIVYLMNITNETDDNKSNRKRCSRNSCHI